MAASMIVLAAGAALPLLVPSLAGVWLSAALVGSSVFMVPSAATGFVKTNLPKAAWGSSLRSEEHTSELQSLMRISYAVFCLKKKNKNTTAETITQKQNLN